MNSQTATFGAPTLARSSGKDHASEAQRTIDAILERGIEWSGMLHEREYDEDAMAVSPVDLEPGTRGHDPFNEPVVRLFAPKEAAKPIFEVDRRELHKALEVFVRACVAFAGTTVRLAAAAVERIDIAVDAFLARSPAASAPVTVLDIPTASMPVIEHAHTRNTEVEHQSNVPNHDPSLVLGRHGYVRLPHTHSVKAVPDATPVIRAVYNELSTPAPVALPSVSLHQDFAPTWYEVSMPVAPHVSHAAYVADSPSHTVSYDSAASLRRSVEPILGPDPDNNARRSKRTGVWALAIVLLTDALRGRRQLT